MLLTYVKLFITSMLTSFQFHELNFIIDAGFVNRPNVKIGTCLDYKNNEARRLQIRQYSDCSPGSLA